MTTPTDDSDAEQPLSRGWRLLARIIGGIIGFGVGLLVVVYFWWFFDSPYVTPYFGVSTVLGILLAFTGALLVAFSPEIDQSRWMFRVLIALQFTGILIGTGFAVAGIESILLSWLLSLTGFGIALLSFRSHRIAGFYFGLSTPTVVIICSSTIWVLEWGPGDAQVPISALLVLYSLACLPLAIFALIEKRRVGRRGRFQFSIASMLGAMVVTAVFFGSLSTRNGQQFAIGVFVAYLIIAMYLVRRFHIGASRVQEAGSPTPLN